MGCWYTAMAGEVAACVGCHARPKDTPIVTYCHHGIRSLEAASYLIGHGFTNVLSLAGGIDAWAKEIDTSLRRY